VSSDVIASAVMKPLGGSIHWKRGTVHKKLVLWLVLGSVPTAFLSVWTLGNLDVTTVQSLVKLALGIALLVVSAGFVASAWVRPDDRRPTPEALPVRRLPTLCVGMFGGAVVGLTSVGSGSLMMLLLLGLYPRLGLRSLIGSDLVQAIPLVLSASIGHLLFGQVDWGVTAAILLGALPGVYAGARFSSRAPDAVIRPALVAVLSMSGLKLLGLTGLPSAAAGALLVTACVLWAVSAMRKKRARAGESFESLDSAEVHAPLP
jgi:uncharacterized membrane protein YfcA